MFRILTILLASSVPLFGHPRLTAWYAPGLDPGAALHDQTVWRAAKPVAVRGAGGIKTPGGTVRALWNEDGVFFLFDLADHRIVSPGKKDGLEQYRLGDTAEAFIGRRGQPGYAEVHVTPAGKKTSYFYRDHLAAAPPPRGAERVRVGSVPTNDGWRAIIAVPWEALGGRGAEKQWDVFFGRYDYDAAGGERRLSSFPALKEKRPSFHRRENYAVMRLKP